jgi:hypothetical protein
MCLLMLPVIKFCSIFSNLTELLITPYTPMKMVCRLYVSLFLSFKGQWKLTYEMSRFNLDNMVYKIDLWCKHETCISS